MHDVIPTLTRSDRHLLAVSSGCFAGAGAATATVDALAPTLGATALAVAGVYCLARYANAVSRRTLASCALACWVAFLAVAGVHAVGLEAVGSAAPGPSGAIVLALSGATWAALLSACSATAFLGFREYGAQPGADAPEEQVLDSETASDY
ncbi:hypothetical protein [Halosolutus gelatinilyticus]|uniref:hypothetical protein n=1 Tax=Halosolutus gelatinilyticus TaxID=2931975 RepID=UPI001FF64DF6|nr:hypothetical protein [Halosolutus gelatinilyticus]